MPSLFTAIKEYNMRLTSLPLANISMQVIFSV